MLHAKPEKIQLTYSWSFWCGLVSWLAVEAVTAVDEETGVEVLLCPVMWRTNVDVTGDDDKPEPVTKLKHHTKD